MSIKYHLIKPKYTFVTVSFPAPGASMRTIKYYLSGNSDAKDNKSECATMSAALATFVTLVESGLGESVKASFSSGLASVTGYIYVDGEFGITINCESKTSAINTILKIIRRVLEKLPLLSKTYKRFVPSDEGFAWACSKIAHGLKDLKFGVVKPGKEFKSNIIDRLSNAVKGITISVKADAEPADAKQRPTLSELCVKTKDPASRFLADLYLKSNKIMFVHNGSCAEVILGNQKADTVKNKLHDKEKIKKFVDQKLMLEKRGDKLPELSLIKSLGAGMILASEIDELLKTNFKSAAIIINALF
jgi:hypothetical protein